MSQEISSNLYPLSSSRLHIVMLDPPHSPYPLLSPVWLSCLPFRDISHCAAFSRSSPFSTLATNLEVLFPCWKPHWFVMMPREGHSWAPLDSSHTWVTVATLQLSPVSEDLTPYSLRAVLSPQTPLLSLLSQPHQKTEKGGEMSCSLALTVHFCPLLRNWPRLGEGVSKTLIG